MIVIGLFLLTAAGADQPDLIGGEWTLTTHILNGEPTEPHSNTMKFLENGTGQYSDSTRAEIVNVITGFLWDWLSDDTFRFTTTYHTSLITISQIGNDEYLYLRTQGTIATWGRISNSWFLQTQNTTADTIGIFKKSSSTE